MKKLFLITCLSPLLLFGQVDSLDLKIGQMIIIGLDNFNTLDKTQRIFTSIEKGIVGNVILYTKHLNDEAPRFALKRINQYIQTLAPIPAFIGIDEEGGYVNRLKPKYGFPKIISAQKIGEINHTDTTIAYAKKSAHTMKSVGINMNFAPTLDVNRNPKNPIIGAMERSYSADPNRVVKHAALVIDTQKKYGIVNVVKHFPGHGSSSTDSHLGMADVSETWDESEIIPYEQLINNGQIPAIMMAHIVNSNLDLSLKPATLSKKIVTDFLRNTLQFQGVVISDDMQMQAISKHYGLEEAIILCINAGVDMIMYANNIESYEKITPETIHQIIKKNVLLGIIPISRIEESYQRIVKLKREKL